jgi:hypothetical protein
VQSLSFKLLLTLTLATLTASCKTPGTASGLKGEGDVADGLNANASDAKERTKWAYRMGLRLASDATVESVQPARFGQAVGIAPGDVVIGLNGRPVRSADNFEQVAKTFVGLGAEAAKWNGVWIVKVRRGYKEFDMQAQKGFDCDPYLLVGCGPLNE